MYVIAASLLGCLAMEVRVFFWGPETPFTRLNFRDEAVIVEEVSPGSAAARAGVRAGDRIIEFAGRRLPVLRDVCSALDAAHRRQLVHRDLK